MGIWSGEDQNTPRRKQADHVLHCTRVILDMF